MSFRSEEVLMNNISESQLKTFYIGFDLGVCRTTEFADILMDAVVDFAFGYHTGILKTYDRRKLIEAAKSIYKIDSFNDVKWTYLDKDSVIDDTDLKAEDKIKREASLENLSSMFSCEIILIQFLWCRKYILKIQMGLLCMDLIRYI